jgi:hypothetical protein
MWFEAGSACFGFAGARRVIFLKNRTLSVGGVKAMVMAPLSSQDSMVGRVV